VIVEAVTQDAHSKAAAIGRRTPKGINTPKRNQHSKWESTLRIDRYRGLAYQGNGERRGGYTSILERQQTKGHDELVELRRA
jgi:hypothetical protein